MFKAYINNFKCTYSIADEIMIHYQMFKVSERCTPSLWGLIIQYYRKVLMESNNLNGISWGFLLYQKAFSEGGMWIFWIFTVNSPFRSWDFKLATPPIFLAFPVTYMRIGALKLNHMRSKFQCHLGFRLKAISKCTI